MSSETVNRKRRRKRRSRRRSRSRAWIAVLAVVLVAAAGAGAWIYFRGLPPKAELYLALRQWTAQWRAGDGSALEEGLRFGAPRADAARAEADDLARTEEERREAMEPYAALLDEPAPEAEEDLLEAGARLDATVLKVGHHGSETSTSYPFLREVMPEYGVISVGTGNTYGHPTQEAMDRLERFLQLSQ